MLRATSLIHRSQVAKATVLSLALACCMQAQGTSVVGQVLYEGPAFVVPVVVVSLPRDSVSWTLSLVGATGTIERKSALGGGKSLVLVAGATPFNANSSNYIYVAGARVDSLSFTNRAVRMSAALRFEPDSSWSTEVRAIGLYQSVSGRPSATLNAWNSPFAGVGLHSGFERLASSDPIHSRWEGFKSTVDVEAFGGSKTWWKSEITAGAGKKFGRLFLGARGSLLMSGNLDEVSRHLVGGNWDLPDEPTLYGYHYGEFRVDHALVSSASADLRVFGETELGVRLGTLNAPGRTAYGSAVQLSSRVGGAPVRVGLAFAQEGLMHGYGAPAPLLYAGIAAGWFRK
jgi:opacity protein-like surface antigen